jgi:hypothetical protein
MYARVVVAAAEKRYVNCQLQSFPGGALNAQLASSASTTTTHGKSLSLAAVKPDSLRMRVSVHSFSSSLQKILEEEEDGWSNVAIGYLESAITLRIPMLISI